MIAGYDSDWSGGWRSADGLDLPGVLASWVPADAVDDAVEVTRRGRGAGAGSCRRGWWPTWS